MDRNLTRQKAIDFEMTNNIPMEKAISEVEREHSYVERIAGQLGVADTARARYARDIAGEDITSFISTYQEAIRELGINPDELKREHFDALVDYVAKEMEVRKGELEPSTESAWRPPMDEYCCPEYGVHRIVTINTKTWNFTRPKEIPESEPTTLYDMLDQTAPVTALIGRHK